MVRIISPKRIRYGAYNTKKGTRYWIEDTKTGSKFKGFTAREFKRVAEKLNATKDISRSFAKLEWQTEKGLAKLREDMIANLRSLLDFQYGASAEQIREFDAMAKELMERGDWNQFVEDYEFLFEDMWANYEAQKPSSNRGYDEEDKPLDDSTPWKIQMDSILNLMRDRLNV